MSDKCKWADETAWDDQYHQTGCGQAQFFSEGSVKENGYKYCPYCGKEIKENTEVKEFE